MVLVFEDAAFTSTFEDPTEGTIVEADNSYVFDEISGDVWKIIMDEGDTYNFDNSAKTGSLIDYENGLVDASGSWNFNFTHYEWEDFDNFSDTSLDLSKWISSNDYFTGNQPNELNGRVNYR